MTRPDDLVEKVRDGCARLIAPYCASAYRVETVIAALYDAIPGLRDVVEGRAMISPGWQPIESAPRDGTHFLVREEGGAIYRASWSEDCWHSYCGQPVVYSPEPIEWMPLPAPYAPAKENGDG